MFDYTTSRALQEHRYVPIPEHALADGAGSSQTEPAAMKRLAWRVVMATATAFRWARSIRRRVQTHHS